MPDIRADIRNRRLNIIAEGEYGGHDLLDIYVTCSQDILHRRYAEKLKHYTPVLPFLGEGSQVVPVGFTSTGAVHLSSLAYLKRLAEAATPP